MALFGLVGALLCLVIETELQGIVPVYLFGSDLGNDAWPRFDDGTGNILPVFVKDAGHADFSSD
jgi:hypothetical protein